MEFVLSKYIVRDLHPIIFGYNKPTEFVNEMNEMFNRGIYKDKENYDDEDEIERNDGELLCSYKWHMSYRHSKSNYGYNHYKFSEHPLVEYGDHEHEIDLFSYIFKHLIKGTSIPE